MIGIYALAFIVGGFMGMLGMAILAYGSKTNLLRENNVLRKRLNFLENEKPRKKFQPVKDPRTNVHTLVS